MADRNPPSDAGRLPGWREALGVGLAVVVIVLGLAVITSVLPASVQDVVFRTPLAIVIMVVGTAAVLVRAARRRAG